MAERIKHFKLQPLEDANFIATSLATYEQEGIKKSWEIVKAHDSVAILIYHKQEESFVLVKQFRPAVYLNNQEGMTVELCAGIVDKELTLEEIAKEEIEEECGYDVPLQSIERITSFHTSVGFAGSKQTLYFTEVDDSMKVSDGGGVENSFKENGAQQFVVAHNAEERNELWYARRNASPSITIFGSKKLNEDISVPRSMLPEALNRIYAIGEKYGFKVPCFGHAGDGNIHVNVMVDGSDEQQLHDGHKAIEEIFELVVEMGGTLSGEHGIGTSKAPFMNIAFNDVEIDLFKSIKHSFDPNNILNPGKMGLPS